KATGWAALIAVAVAAVLDAGPTRKPHWISLAYLALALLAPVYVLTTEDNLFALAIRAQWLMLVLAAIAVTRRIHDADSLWRVIRALQIGFAIALLIPLADLVASGAGALRAGLGRFEPFDANSNQIGILFAQGFVFNLYAALRDRTMLLRPVWAGFAAAALGMALLTGSRSTFAACIFPAIPIGLAMLRRPAFILAALPVMALMALFVLRQVDDYSFSRLNSLQTERVSQAADYINLSIAERPVAGLLGTNGMNSEVDQAVGTHSHNAYLGAAYIGGLSYLIPLLALAAASLLAAFYVWRNRRLFDADPTLISTLCFLMVMVYAHGFVNTAIYYPTYVWAFLHVTLSILLTTMAVEVVRARRAGLVPAKAPGRAMATPAMA
ncbi:MAG: hypothetical protein ACF8R7_09160, partial [Phycisphaerales bacterium JB039]